MKDRRTSAIAFALLAILCAFAAWRFIPKDHLSADAQRIESECAGRDHTETCFAKAFGELDKRTDMRHAFDVLHELQRSDDQAKGCHFIAHEISEAETEKDPSRWREVMNSAPQDCSYGAAHGALEVHAKQFPGGKLPKSEISTICNNPDTNNCTHILGHLLLIMNENDLNQSLNDCGRLPNDNFEKFECLTGVFMERITAINLIEHGLADQSALAWGERLPELESLCREQSGTDSVACWQEIAHAAVVRFGSDAQKVSDFCSTAPSTEASRQCLYHALGIMSANYGFDLSKEKGMCEIRVGDPDFKDSCYAHLVSSSLSTLPDQSLSAVRFCSSLDAKYQDDCFAMIGNSLRNASQTNRDLLEKSCSAVLDTDLKKKCMNGGNINAAFYNGD